MFYPRNHEEITFFCQLVAGALLLLTVPDIWTSTALKVFFIKTASSGTFASQNLPPQESCN